MHKSKPTNKNRQFEALRKTKTADHVNLGEELIPRYIFGNLLTGQGFTGSEWGNECSVNGGDGEILLSKLSQTNSRKQ